VIGSSKISFGIPNVVPHSEQSRGGVVLFVLLRDLALSTWQMEIFNWKCDWFFWVPDDRVKRHRQDMRVNGFDTRGMWHQVISKQEMNM
jgi:hypothetical protein